MFLGMDIYSWIAAIVIALIVTFLPITLPFKIVLAMVAMACFYFGRKYYHNHKNGGAETPSTARPLCNTWRVAEISARRASLTFSSSTRMRSAS